MMGGVANVVVFVFGVRGYEGLDSEGSWVWDGWWVGSCTWVNGWNGWGCKMRWNI